MMDNHPGSGRVNFCHACTDGECFWEECPQLRDNEPEAHGLTGLPSDMLAALDILVTRAAGTPAQRSARERLQAAWDSYPFGLPPIDFTDAEAEHLQAALSSAPASKAPDHAQ